MKREFDEAFVLEEGSERRLGTEMRKLGLKHLKGGRLHHAMMGHDKGKAVKRLIGIFRKEFGDVNSIGLGDSPNDFEMLRAVDKGYLARKKSGEYASREFARANGEGPAGWNMAVKGFVKMR